MNVVKKQEAQYETQQFTQRQLKKMYHYCRCYKRANEHIESRTRLRKECDEMAQIIANYIDLDA